jgi:hypothetical protein
MEMAMLRNKALYMSPSLLARSCFSKRKLKFVEALRNRETLTVNRYFSKHSPIFAFLN